MIRMGGKLTKGIEWIETMFDSILWASVAWMFHFDQLWPTRKLKDEEEKTWKQECSNRWLVWYLEQRRKYVEEKWSESFPRDHRWPAARPACFWPGRGQHVPSPILECPEEMLCHLFQPFFLWEQPLSTEIICSKTFKCHGWGITFKVFQLVLFA